MYFVLGICYFYVPVISKSNSLVVKWSPRNPWIKGLNPGGRYTSFSVSHRINPFSSENCSFCTLRSFAIDLMTCDILINYTERKYHSLLISFWFVAPALIYSLFAHSTVHLLILCSSHGSLFGHWSFTHSLFNYSVLFLFCLGVMKWTRNV